MAGILLKKWLPRCIPFFFGEIPVDMVPMSVNMFVSILDSPGILFPCKPNDHPGQHLLTIHKTFFEWLPLITIDLLRYDLHLNVLFQILFKNSSKYGFSIIFPVSGWRFKCGKGFSQSLPVEASHPVIKSKV